MNQQTNKNPTLIWWIFTLIIGGAAFSAGMYLQPKQSGHKVIGTMVSNDQFIRGLFSHFPVDTGKNLPLFRNIFMGLPDQVTVFPTENIYYVNLYVNGKLLKCSIGLPHNLREKDQIRFGFHESIDKWKTKSLNNPGVYGGGDLGETDGVRLNKVSDFQYQVTFEDKTVHFHLNDIGIAPPKKAQLMEDEVYVGPCFDESGLGFYLVFNESTSHLYWILNEDMEVAETLVDCDNGLLIGNRTDFAFYNDTANNRKILFGAKGKNVLNNTWYDGPFDHMPDNYVATDAIEVKKYLEARYPQHRGKLDKFGRFLGKSNSRVAVANYRVYFSMDDLKAHRNCRKDSITDSEFYTCLTQQVYRLPKEFYNL